MAHRKRSRVRRTTRLRPGQQLRFNFGPRTRKYWIRYGGEKSGNSNIGDLFVPAISGLHSCTDETHPGPPYSDGGPLFVTKRKVYIKRTKPISIHYNIVPQAWYDGFMSVKTYIPSPEPTPLSLSGWGAKGWALTQPLHPVYNLGVSIGELKDFPDLLRQTLRGFKVMTGLGNPLTGIPRTVRELLRTWKKLPANTGSTFLYGAFGLAPLLQDLLFLLQAQEKLNKKIRWLRRHNGKRVRRKIELDNGGFSESIARSLSPFGQFDQPLNTNLYAGGQTTAVSCPVTKTYKRRIWYAAEYRYWIPELSDESHGLPPPRGLTFDLLGLSPDPSIIYKLIPWSWLLDWFTSCGALLSNIYARVKYHVVARYAYVMCSESFTYEAPGYVVMHQGVRTAPGWSLPDRRHGGISRTVYEFRQREVANPYGFGTTFASLSAYQWSILVALGLSRRSKSSSPRT